MAKAHEIAADMLERVLVDGFMETGLGVDERHYRRYARDVGMIAARAVRSGDMDEIIGCVKAMERNLLFIVLFNFKDGAQEEVLNSLREEFKKTAPMAAMVRETMKSIK